MSFNTSYASAAAAGGLEGWERNPDATIYVGNLDGKVDEELLWELFVQCGPIQNVSLPRDRIVGSHQGYGFVEFKNPDDADYAVKIMNLTKLFSKPIRCNKSSSDKIVRDEVGANLFIGNLGPDVDEKQLYDTFSAFGIVVFCKIMRSETGESKGFGFVSYDGFEASDAAMAGMNGQYLCNRQISVSYSYKKDSKGERHGTAAERLLAANRDNAHPHGMENEYYASVGMSAMPQAAPAPLAGSLPANSTLPPGMSAPSSGTSNFPTPPMPPPGMPFPPGMPPPPGMPLPPGMPPPPGMPLPPGMPPPPGMPLPPGMPPPHSANADRVCCLVAAWSTIGFPTVSKFEMLLCSFLDDGQFYYVHCVMSTRTPAISEDFPHFLAWYGLIPDFSHLAKDDKFHCRDQWFRLKQLVDCRYYAHLQYAESESYNAKLVMSRIEDIRWCQQIKKLPMESRPEAYKKWWVTKEHRINDVWEYREPPPTQGLMGNVD